MSDQYPPFVVNRPDGFVGIELSISDQLTIEQARLLAWQLLVSARRAELGSDYLLEAPAWLVWERDLDGGRPWLRAIDLSEEKAERHVAYLKEEAKHYRPSRSEPDLLIEETRLNHLYASGIVAALLKRGK